MTGKTKKLAVAAIVVILVVLGLTTFKDKSKADAPFNMQNYVEQLCFGSSEVTLLRNDLINGTTDQIVVDQSAPDCADNAPTADNGSNSTDGSSDGTSGTSDGSATGSSSSADNSTNTTSDGGNV